MVINMDLFIQELSFIGWAIVGSLCLGVGSFWVGTYINAAKAVFYNELLKKEVVETVSDDFVEVIE